MDEEQLIKVAVCIEDLDEEPPIRWIQVFASKEECNDACLNKQCHRYFDTKVMTIYVECEPKSGSVVNACMKRNTNTTATVTTKVQKGKVNYTAILSVVASMCVLIGVAFYFYLRCKSTNRVS